MPVTYECDLCHKPLTKDNSWVIPENRQVEGVEVLCKGDDPKDPNAGCIGEVFKEFEPFFQETKKEADKKLDDEFKKILTKHKKSAKEAKKDG